MDAMSSGSMCGVLVVSDTLSAYPRPAKVHSYQLKPYCYMTMSIYDYMVNWLKLSLINDRKDAFKIIT